MCCGSFQRYAKWKESLDFKEKKMNAKLGKSRSMDLLDPCAMRFILVWNHVWGPNSKNSSVICR